MLASPFARRYFTPKRQLRVRAYFRKFGSKVVLIGRFTPGFRFTIFFTAGTLHLRPSVFLIYDFSAAAFSVPVLVYSAWYFGGQIDRVVKYARQTEHGILVAIAVGAGRGRHTRLPPAQAPPWRCSARTGSNPTRTSAPGRSPRATSRQIDGAR